MGLFSKANENNEQQHQAEKQKLMDLSEKELMVEILLELKELNRQSKKIQRNQILWSD